MATELEALLVPGRTALVVIDMQNDYLHPRGAIGRSGKDLSALQAILPRVHALIEAAHRSGVLVIFTRNWGSAVTDSPAWSGRPAAARHDAAGVAGTWGAAWYEVQPLPGDIVIDKYRHDAFHATPLELILRARGIEVVVCCGVVTNVCVETTARSAATRDFRLVVVEDGCGSRHRDLHEATMENVRRTFGVVAAAGEVAAAWRAMPAAVG
jgi:ureidoacrylate peracid hydrolase